jgi:hypothetical protein
MVKQRSLKLNFKQSFFSGFINIIIKVLLTGLLLNKIVYLENKKAGI